MYLYVFFPRGASRERTVLTRTVDSVFDAPATCGVIMHCPSKWGHYRVSENAIHPHVRLSVCLMPMLRYRAMVTTEH